MFHQFPNKKLDLFPKELKKLLDSHRDKVTNVIDSTPDTYDKLLSPLQDIDEELSLFFTPLSHLNSTMNSEESQLAYEKCIPLLSAYQSEMSHNKRLYDALKRIQPTRENRRRVLDHMLRDFRLSGADLDIDSKKRIEEIDLRLSELSNDFSRNLLESTNEWEMILHDPTDIEGMSESDLQAARIESDGEVKYRFTLQMPSYISYMTYGPNRDKRREMHRAYTTRAPKNEKVIDELLSLRQEKAKILGFENYAQYALQTRDARNTSDVTGFLNELADAALSRAHDEMDELKEFALATDEVQLAAYDTTYYGEKLKRSKFGFDDSMTKPYFEQNKVLEGMLEIVSELFGVSFVETIAPVWHDSVRVFDISEKNKNIARIYFDLEARREKRGGAWMHDWESHFTDSKGQTHLPSAFVVANFPPASPDAPSLLRHNDVVTLFHEMGHALHHLFSRQTERSISGINGVSWDVVEFPSQFMENFAYEKAILKRFGYHYKTNQPIPNDLIIKIKESKNFQSALGILRQVEFSLFDILLHQKLYQGAQVQKLLDTIRTKTSLLPSPSYSRFQHGFSHIFAGGYAAGYYSYKWAEVFSAEAFFACVDTETGLNQDKALGYKEHILSNGSLRDMSQLFVEWLGHKPSVKSLGKLYGIESGSNDERD